MKTKFQKSRTTNRVHQLKARRDKKRKIKMIRLAKERKVRNDQIVQAEDA